MSFVLFTECYENCRHLKGFIKGEEASFDYVYKQAWKPLLRYGLRIIPDEFTVSCIVQDAFLKCWQFRATMESMRHIYYFTRQQVMWKCFAWLKNPVNRFHSAGISPADRLLSAEEASAVKLIEAGRLSLESNEEKRQLIDAAIPYLSPARQNIVRLYFEYGYSCKQIARRYGNSANAVSMELQKSLDFLKKILIRPPKEKPAAGRNGNAIPVPTANNTGEMIFRLRREEKMDFLQIAERLGLAPSDVQQQYLEIHRMLKKAG